MSNRIPHKTSRHLFASLFIFYFLSVLITHDSHARDVTAGPVYVKARGPEAGIVEQFVRQGRTCSRQGDVPGAIDSFARALLLDPSHKTARAALISISAQNSLPAAQRIQLFLSTDLLAFDEKLRKRLDFFAARRDALAATLIQQNYPQTAINREFQSIRDRFALPADDHRGDIGPISPLETLNKFLMREQKRLSRKLSHAQEQLAWLQKTETLRRQPESRAKGEGPGEPWQQIAGVREELGELRRQVETLQEDVKHKDDRIMALTNQVVEFSLKLTEREMILSEKVNALGSLHEAYTELQARQELGQRILEEKNVQIQSLQEGLAALQADTALHTKEINGLIAAKDQALDQWENILAIYQGELKDATETIDARNGDISTLQEQLAMVRTKLFEKETSLEKTKEKLVSLEKQFQSVVSDPK